jgi:aminoglycoside 3-N-acetyltransferase
MTDKQASALATHAARYPHGPVTATQLAQELTALGVRPGMLLMVHCSLRRLGWVLGGPVGVYHALTQVCNYDVGDPALPAGTVLMPAFDSNNSEPSYWRNPPCDPQWWPVLRETRPGFDPATTPSIRMGALAEYFRTLLGTQRSNHPHVSWCGRGPLATSLLANCPLDFALGEDSPLGRAYAADGWVLSLGTAATTILHLAEHRCDWNGKAVQRQGGALLVDGERRWVEYDMLTDANDDFEELRQDFRSEHAAQRGSDWQHGPCGYGTAQLLRIRPLVDFAVDWLPRHRR